MVPTGAQNMAEPAVDFVDDGIILQTIGPDGMKFLPFLLSLFFFVFFTNIFEIIPFIQFPANARMANPLFLALIVWVTFHLHGLQEAGLSGLHRARPSSRPGVPKALYVLVTPIEFLSTFLVRPVLPRRPALRQHAGRPPAAGDLRRADRCAALPQQRSRASPVAVLPFAMDVAITGFEVLVAVLQAFIFTILTAVYIGGAMHPEH